MTRINVGYPVEALCDSHLVAEYRELPRVFKHTPKSAIPAEFKLGTGHVNWCSQYQHSLRVRHHQLCEEMKYRGFKVNFYTPMPKTSMGRSWTWADEEQALPLVRERILKRLESMSHAKWTRRS